MLDGYPFIFQMNDRLYSDELIQCSDNDMSSKLAQVIERKMEDV